MEQVINYFLRPENGIQGIIIVALGSIVVWQQKRLDSKDKQITELQNQRLADTNSHTEKYTEVATQMVSATKDSVNAMGLLQRSIDSLAQAFQAFINGKK